MIIILDFKDHDHDGADDDVLVVWWSKVTLAINPMEFNTPRQWLIGFWVFHQNGDDNNVDGDDGDRDAMWQRVAFNGGEGDNGDGDGNDAGDDNGDGDGGEGQGPGKPPLSWTALPVVSRWPALLSPNGPRLTTPGKKWWDDDDDDDDADDDATIKLISHLSTSDISELLKSMLFEVDQCGREDLERRHASTIGCFHKGFPGGKILFFSIRRYGDDDDQ